MADDKVISESEELPKAIVRRVVKDKLSQISSSNDTSEISVYKESLQAFSESARIFIHYLSATANDICKESKRQTINADDVFKALEEMEFSEFIGPLKVSLEEFKRKNAGKKTASKAKESNKKQKIETPVENGGDEEEIEADDDNVNEDGDDDNLIEDDDDDNINGDGDDNNINGDGDDNNINGDGDDNNINRDGDDNNINGDGDDTPDDDQ